MHLRRLRSRHVAALVLIGAAFLTTHELATVPTEGLAFLESRTFLVLLTQLELGIGIWALVGKHQLKVERVLLWLFSSFFAISVAKFVRGDADCGCFGVITVSPIYTIVLDAGLIVWLAKDLKQQAIVATRLGLQPFVMWMLIIASVFTSLFLILRFKTTTLEELANASGDDTVVLRPNDWVGRKLPILKYVEPPHELGNGRWLCVLVKPDCPACEDVIAASASPETTIAVAYIDIGVHASKREDGNWFRLTDNYRWFSKTPILIHLDDGIVKHVADQFLKSEQNFTSSNQDTHAHKHFSLQVR